MEKLEKIIEQLQACAEAIAEIEKSTLYKGPLIDAGYDVSNAIKHVERHARNEARRANV